MVRLAVISDVHLGDSQSTMAFREAASGRIALGSRYQEFADTVRAQGGAPLDYLVLLGDILDFSVCNYAEAYEIGRFFFQQLRADDLAKEIIYIPGNHDFDLWSTVEYQVNIINRIDRGEVPTRFRMSVPGILDDRSKGMAQKFVLHNVRSNKGLTKYGGLFLDKITQPVTNFNFAYPNLYLLTDEQTILLTHGQYLEPFWSLMGHWAMTIFGDALRLEDSRLMNLRELVAVNDPLSQLSCIVIGQAGPLTDVVQRLEHEIKQKNLKELSGYLDRLGDELRKRTTGVLYWSWPMLFSLAKREVLKRVGGIENARYSTEFINDTRVRGMLQDYYTSTVCELSEMKEKYGTDIPLPTAMIFGHTHQPIPWGAADAPVADLSQLKGKKFPMYNTGGWLCSGEENGVLQFCGAEVFFYETGKGMSSQSIGGINEQSRHAPGPGGSRPAELRPSRVAAAGPAQA